MNQIFLAFLTGLTTGGISCIAVQGGLLASSIANQEGYQETKSSNAKFVAMFLIAKLFAYTFLGFLLGYLGSLLILSLKVQAILQIVIGIFLLGTAGKLLNLHPIFRYFSVSPPKFIYKILKNESKHTHLLAPAFLGALTVLIPCGVTQAVMAVALSTGNPSLAAAIMFAFVLGTSPVFFLLGISIGQFLKRKAFVYVASFVIFIFGVLSLNGAMGLLGSPHTIQNYWSVLTRGDLAPKTAVNNGKFQEATIYVSNNGYKSDVTTLKVGIPVKLRLVTNKTFSCARAFTIPSLRISKILAETGVEIIEFTPQKMGRLAYSCSMGMYTGSFNIVE